jgi:hypothetical protein
MEDLAHAVERLTEAGYRDDFRAERDGLRAVRSGRTYEPESLVVDEVARFEGDSDPDDEVVVFALRSESSDVRGTYVVTYGTYVAPADAVMLRRLTPRVGSRAARPDRARR